MPKWMRIQGQASILEETGQSYRRIAYHEQLLITSGDDDSDDYTPRLPAPKLDSRALLGLLPIGVMILHQVLKWRNQSKYPALPAGTAPALPAPAEKVIIEIHEPSNILESR